MSIEKRKMIACVVKDIDSEMERWGKLLGIPTPRIWNIPGPEVAPTLTNGQLEIYKNCRISVIQFENLAMEVVQPGEEPSPWKTYLEEHGEGFQHMSFLVPDEKEALDTIKETCNVDGYYHIGYYPSQSYGFIDTFDSLKTELNIKVDKDNTEIINELQRREKA